MYGGGLYGTFIEWCLCYFSQTDFSSEFPFNSNGNSHLYDGNFQSNLVEYLNSKQYHRFARCHFRTSESLSVFESFEKICASIPKIVYMHLTENSMIWTMNNKFEKILDPVKWLQRDLALVSDRLQNWGENKRPENLETWELREFLSFYLYDQHAAEMDLHHTDEFRSRFSDCKFIDVADLRDNFSNVIVNLMQYLDLEFVRKDFDRVYKKWIVLQTHCYKDQLIKSIVLNLLNNKYQEWNNSLTLVDEAMIQYFLRNHGYELQCHGLNHFPSNTKDLKKVMYQVQS